MKTKLKEILKKVEAALKVTIFLTVMTMGFFIIFCMIWLKCGFTTVDWAKWMLMVLSLISTRLFL